MALLVTALQSKHMFLRFPRLDVDIWYSRCGSQADTAIIRDSEIGSGKCGPLGRTQGNGPVDAGVMIAAFMGTGAIPTNAGATAGVGAEDNIPKNAQKLRRQLGGLFGGLGGGATGFAGLLGGGGDKATGPPEAGVAAAAGQDASTGLPTANADGTVDMTFPQVREPRQGP